MIYTERTKKAIILIMKAHEGQIDKGGYPYVCHPLHVAESMKNESSCLVALLHDVLEDCPNYDIESVSMAVGGLSAEEKEALLLLTHDPDVPYIDYCKALAVSPIARKVKMSDLRHNLDTTRTNGIKPPKYLLMVECLEYLSSYK